MPTEPSGIIITGAESSPVQTGKGGTLLSSVPCCISCTTWCTCQGRVRRVVCSKMSAALFLRAGMAWVPSEIRREKEGRVALIIQPLQEVGPRMDAVSQKQ